MSEPQTPSSKTPRGRLAGLFAFLWAGLRTPSTLASIATGALIVIAFPPWNLSLLIFVALVPWWVWRDPSAPLRRRLLNAWLVGFVMSLGGFSWVAYAIHHFGGLPYAVALLGLLVFSSLNELQFLAFELIYSSAEPRLRRAARYGFLIPVAAAFLYLIPDQWVFRLFEDSLGHALYNRPWLRQLASLAGVPILTLSIFVVNFALAEFCREARRTHLMGAFKARWPELATLSGVLVILSLGGRALEHSTLDAEHRLAPVRTRIAVIQANIGDFEKVAALTGHFGAGERIIKNYLQLSTQSIESQPDVIVWPETAYPSTFRKPSTPTELERDQWVEQWVRGLGDRLLWFGGYDRDEKHDYNTVFFVKAPKVSSEELEVRAYHKTVLLPFGEYLPGGDYYPEMKKWFPQMGFFGRGPGPTVYPSRARNGAELRVLPLICYEALFPEFTQPAPGLGANMILNVTNDSWFGPFGEPDLHLALTVFRSIETRLPQLRATNTGYSALIHADGRIDNPTNLFERQAAIYELPVHPAGGVVPGLSLTRVGLLWARVATALLALGLLGFGLWSRFGRKSARRIGSQLSKL